MSTSRLPSSSPNTTLLPSALPHGRAGSTASIPQERPAASPEAGDQQTLAGAGYEEPGMEAEGDGATRPPFKPFFTLVEDSSTQLVAHPSVSYIFTDDEHDPAVDASLRIAARAEEQQRRRLRREARRGAPPQSSARPKSVQESKRRKSTQGQAAAEETEEGSDEDGSTWAERYVVVNLGADGRSIVSAQSLTPDWHVDAAELSAAPTLEGNSGGGSGGGVLGMSPASIGNRIRRASSTVNEQPRVEEEIRDNKGAGPLDDNGPLMLRLEGRGVSAGFDDVEAAKLGIEGLCELFKASIDDLRRVVEAGGQVMHEWQNSPDHSEAR